MVKVTFTLGPACCLSIGGQRGFAGLASAPGYPMNLRDDFAAEEVKETVRTYFPETWIWDLVPLE